MKYGLIGECLGHSYSPEIHSMIADYSYELIELPPEKLGLFLEKREFCAINVTIPYKQAVIPYLDEISETAMRIGAVNTVVNRNGRLYGYNTDFSGMRALIQYAGFDFGGKTVMILGTGGTSKTAAAVAQSLGAEKIIHVSRKSQEDCITYEDAPSRGSDARFIINTTPVGMYPNTEKCAIDVSLFPQLEGVIDAVYNPLRTELVRSAREHSIKAFGGLYMLAAQAVYASSLFLGKEPDTSLISKTYRAIMRQKQNTVLIGMPSAGKTTVGRLIAKLEGRNFIDTDEVIVSRIGMPVSEYFALYGEKKFRELEREVIAQEAKRSGCVIATGGGAVLDGDNIKALRRNSVIVFLDRPIEKLIFTDDRPLSSSRDALDRLYRERYELYLKAADVRIDAGGDIESTAQAVCKELDRLGYSD